jgi:glycine/D-amino acid oxidase-like deaminating enzyme
MAVSFWLDDAQDDLTPRPPLDGSTRVDVAIVGAGFTGLWTARELLRRDPTLEVLVCEAAFAGFGASGRNGAWLSPGIAVGPAELARRTSPETARATVAAMRDTVDEVLRACDEDGIDAQGRKGGLLRVARGPHELPTMRAGYDELATLSVADGIELLSNDDLAARVRIAGAEGALFDPHAAAIHPGRLVRGLARTVERLGARIVEQTPVADVLPRGASPRTRRSGSRREHDTTGTGHPPRPRLVTACGDIHAEVVVLASEAWTSQLPRRGRDVLPLYSLIVLTEPVDDSTWSEIGWQRHELLSSHRYTVDYLSRTPDGRVLFGGRGAPYHYGSRIRAAYDRHGPTHALLREQLRTWFPPLADVGFSHAWGGPLAMPRDWMPTFRHDPRSGVAAAIGYTGQGVATSNLAGRVLADLIVHGETPYAELPMVGHRSRRWEPEPLRWLGARYLQRALPRIDSRAATSGHAPTGRSLAERLMRH